MTYLHHASIAVGLLGALVILLGVLRGLMAFVRAEATAAGGHEVSGPRRELRQVLGYHLLLGLEFLIAADILDTLMTPQLNELLTLGVIVLIRTVISHSLNAELRPETADRPASHA
jgi:uncharacterized membrane protein